MKKIILGIIATTLIVLPCTAQEIKLNLAPVKKALVVTGRTAYKVVKYPFVLTSLTLGKIANNEVGHTLRQAWRLSN